MNWIKLTTKTIPIAVYAYLICTNHCHAQSSDVFGKIEVIPIPREIPGKYYYIFPDSACTSYLLTTSVSKNPKAWSDQTIHINEYDCDLKYKRTSDFKGIMTPQSNIYKSVHFFHPKDNLLVTSLNVEKESIQVNGEGINTLQGSHLISTFMSSGTFKAKIREGISSPDSSFFALIINVESSDTKQSFVSIFDAHLKEAYTYRLDHGKEMTDVHFILNNKGELMVFEVSQSDLRSKERRPLTINFYSLKNNKIEKIYTTADKLETYHSYMGTTENGNYNHYFIKSHEAVLNVKDRSGKLMPEKGDKYELYSVSFDPNFQKVFEVKNELDQSMIEEALKGVRKAFGLHLEGMFLQKNKTFIGIADAADDDTYISLSTEIRSVFLYNGILIFNIDTDGKLLTSKVIVRSRSVNWAGLGTVTPVRVHDGVFFSYFVSKNEIYLVKARLDDNEQIGIVKRKIDQQMAGGGSMQHNTLVSDGDHTVYADLLLTLTTYKPIRINTD